MTRMIERSFESIVEMLKKACARSFYNNPSIDVKTIIECATQIYIAQMNTRTPKERGGEK